MTTVAGNRSGVGYYDETTDEIEEDDPLLDFDCALGPDGQCGKAGSEECDWDCPYSHGEFYAGSEAWNAKHDAGLPVEGCDCQECLEAQRNANQK